MNLFTFIKTSVGIQEQALRGTGAGVEAQPHSLGQPARRLEEADIWFDLSDLNQTHTALNGIYRIFGKTMNYRTHFAVSPLKASQRSRHTK